MLRLTKETLRSPVQPGTGGLDAKVFSHKVSAIDFMGSILGPNCVIAKDVKSCSYYCYVRCAIWILRVGEYVSPKEVQLFTMHYKYFQTTVV